MSSLNSKLSLQACFPKLLSAQYHNDTIYNDNHFKRKHVETQFWPMFEITKCWHGLENKVRVIKLSFLPPPPLKQIISTQV